MTVIMRSLILALLIILTGGCTHGPKTGTERLQVVSGVDLARYMGVRYEIARYPNSFQEGCDITGLVRTVQAK